MQFATDTRQAATATEHSQQALLLQSTEMHTKIVFINIGMYQYWQRTRMRRTSNGVGWTGRWEIEPNMTTLANTIGNVVQNMEPTMICMVAVGEATQPLSEEQMQQVATESTRAWKDAATERIQLRSMFTTGEPYMTIYIDGHIRCTEHRILRNLYYTGGRPRTAQAFACSLPGDESIDVVNVNVKASGNWPLSDFERRTLLKNLLQSNSLARQGSSIGKADFVIGGDMNTCRDKIAELLQACRQNGSLHILTQTHDRTRGKHGDLCIVGGRQATTLMTTAENHNPQHDPYGIYWSIPVRPATEQPPEPTSEMTVTDRPVIVPTGGAAREHACQRRRHGMPMCEVCEKMHEEPELSSSDDDYLGAWQQWQQEEGVCERRRHGIATCEICEERHEEPELSSSDEDYLRAWQQWQQQQQ